MRLLLLVLGALGLIACKPKDVGAPTSALSDSTGTFVVIEPAPDHLRGRVALVSGARLYASPRFGSSSWTLALPDPPLAAVDDGLARARALRVVGVSGDFLALTNDLADDSGLGCGRPIAGSEHLRMLFYVPPAHLAPVLTRPLELEPLGDAGLLRVSAGARVGPPIEEGGMPSPGPGNHWRALDADGLRMTAPVPDDAVGVAWDPAAAQIEFDAAGVLLFRDAEGNNAWMNDPGGDELDMSLRNACAEHLQTLRDPDEVAGLRELAATLTTDAGADEGEWVEPPEQPPEGPWRLVVGTDLRWTDGNLAAEVVAPFEIAALGQDWEDRRCFTLLLGDELRVVDEQPPVTCVRPEQLEFVGDQISSFDRGLELEIGGTVRFGQPSVEGPWGPDVVRELLNGHHSTIAECLRPLAARLEHEGLPSAGRWRLELQVDGKGRVVDALVEPIATSDVRVEDCLRAETGTWLLPPGAGKLIVALEFGDAQVLGNLIEEQDIAEAEAAEAKSKPKSKSKSKSKAKAKDEPAREPGRVMIIRDEEGSELEELPPTKKKPPAAADEPGEDEPPTGE
ncbi:hypothetical protein ACNOYE_20955 [Nannocystaceae bacterium ST9]